MTKILAFADRRSFDSDYAAELWRSGMSCRAVGAVLGVSGNAVWLALRSLGMAQELAERRGPFVSGHKNESRWPMRTLEQRFREKFVVQADGCWIWTSTLNHGYGWFGGADRVPRNAHRVAWEMWRGPIPPKMVVDHLCHTRDLLCFDGPCLHRRCVNPAHLELVTLSENKRRGRARIQNFHLTDLLA